jgi:hypothetical protein
MFNVFPAKKEEESCVKKGIPVIDLCVSTREISNRNFI